MKYKNITGILFDYFETGSEGTIWAIQDEKHIDAKGMYSHEGTHYLKTGDYLSIYYPSDAWTPDPSRLCWEGKLALVTLYSTKLEQVGLAHYVKKHETGLEQLCLGGHWVHSLPANFDLALWYRIFCLNEKWVGVLTTT